MCVLMYKQTPSTVETVELSAPTINLVTKDNVETAQQAKKNVVASASMYKQMPRTAENAEMPAVPTNNAKKVNVPVQHPSLIAMELV